MLIKLLQDYGDHKSGTEWDTETNEDAQRLIDDGVAEKVESKDTAPEINEDSIAEKVAEKVKAEIKASVKIPAQAKDDKSPWPTLGHFARSVMTGVRDQKLMGYCAGIDKASGMSIAINADGGFLIPPEYSTALLSAMAAAGVIAPKCINFPINNNIALPFVNNTSQATSWTGGCTVYKMGEGVDKTGSKPSIAKAELKLNKMAVLVYATDELLQDSAVALETFLTTMASTEFALTKDEDIINGSGAGEALGVMNAPCLISIPKESGQVATTLVYENALKMWSRLSNMSRSKAIWLINQDCMEQVATWVVNVGTGGAPVIVVNATTQIPQTIFGAPIVWSPHCQTIGTTGDIILGDFSQYITATKAGKEMDVATSIHLKFVEDETAFRFVIRFDGQPWWASAITPKHGTNTVSPFLAVATR